MALDSFYRSPPTLESISLRLRDIVGCSELFRLSSAGDSVLGRPLWYLLAGDFSAPPVLLIGCTHGSEWITAMLLLLFAESLTDAMEHQGEIAGIRVEALFHGRSLLLLPCLNPDGMEISLYGSDAAGERRCQVARMMRDFPEQVWQANARGVDLNHNFPAGWEIVRDLEKQNGILGPGPTKYGGPCPFSEPETQAVRKLCSDFPVRQVLSFHSQGEEIYWRYGSRTPGRGLMVARLFSASSGYQVCDPAGTASHGGLKDWFIQETGRPGFTLEVGKGKNPLPIEQLPDIWGKLKETLMLSILV